MKRIRWLSIEIEKRTLTVTLQSGALPSVEEKQTPRQADPLSKQAEEIGPQIRRKNKMLKSLKMCALACGLWMVHGSQAHAAWQPMSANSPIPVNATPFPNDYRPASAPGNLPGPYVCRAAFMGGEQPGWTNPGDGACHIGWGGLEHLVSPYDMWVEDWQPASNGNVPGNALIFGEEQAQVPPPGLSPQKWRYACQAYDPDYGIASGKVAPDIGGCDFPWGNYEQHATTYNVLVDSTLSMIDSAGGPKTTVSAANPSITSSVGPYAVRVAYGHGDSFQKTALIAGHEAYGGPALYLCSAYYQDGYHIGKIRVDFAGCDISYGGREILGLNPYYIYYANWTGNFQNNVTYFQYPYIPIAQQVLDQNSGKPVPGEYASAVIGGYEQDGASLYLCGAYVYPLNGLTYIPGRLRPGLGGCSVGLEGKEMIYPNYLVLEESWMTPISVR